MYVLVDMEWISNQHGNHWPTQLAAARVDAQWNTVDTFSVLFRPRDFSLQQWGHMAFSGWSREQFLDGESLYAGLDAFRLWLQPEDTICWWHQEASDLFNMFSKVSGVPDMTQHVVLLCDYIYGYLSMIDQSSVDKSTEQWLGTIESRLHYERWFCGHYHTDKEIDKIRFMFQDYTMLPHQISLSAEKEMIRRMQRQAEIVEALGLMDEAQEEK